jgi:hypothetical protein
MGFPWHLGRPNGLARRPIIPPCSLEPPGDLVISIGVKRIIAPAQATDPVVLGWWTKEAAYAVANEAIIGEAQGLRGAALPNRLWR